MTYFIGCLNTNTGSDSHDEALATIYCVHHQIEKTWEPAIVVGKPTTHWYDIKTEQRSTYQRNRRQLNFNLPMINDNDVTDNLAEPLNNPTVTSHQSTAASPYVTCSGRVLKPPDRLMYQ